MIKYNLIFFRKNRKRKQILLYKIICIINAIKLLNRIQVGLELSKP